MRLHKSFIGFVGWAGCLAGGLASGLAGMNKSSKLNLNAMTHLQSHTESGMNT